MDQVVPGAVVTSISPHERSSWTLAVVPNAPSRVIGVPPPATSVHGVEMSGTATNIAPSSTPGTAAATTPAGTAADVRRRTSAAPMAITATGQYASTSTTRAGSRTPADTRSVTPPAATRKAPK